MKNRRDICFAKSAGFIEFNGLPGSIMTGCQASPGYKSRYCNQHRIHACDSRGFDTTNEDTSDLDAPVGSVLRSKRKNRQQGENLVKMITAKKETRSCTYYKVKSRPCILQTLPLPYVFVRRCYGSVLKKVNVHGNLLQPFQNSW